MTTKKQKKKKKKKQYTKIVQKGMEDFLGEGQSANGQEEAGVDLGTKLVGPIVGKCHPFEHDSQGYVTKCLLKRKRRLMAAVDLGAD